MAEFLGLDQYRRRVCHQPPSSGAVLETGGILKVTRHPWYLGALLLIWSGHQDAADLLVHAILSIYLVVGTWLEERKLVGKYGDRYRAYQQRVSMLPPLKWIVARLRH